MSGIWTEIIRDIGIFSISAGLIVWLIKKIAIYYFSKNLEAYKLSLKSNAEKEIENLKAQLQIASQQHQIRFSMLHEKRAEIIAELYALLAEADSSTNFFFSVLKITDFKNVKELAKDSFTKIYEFANYFRKHNIYLSKDLCESINNFFASLAKPILQYKLLDMNSEEEIKEFQDFFNSWQLKKDEISLIRRRIEKEFRDILGVDIK